MRLTNMYTYVFFFFCSEIQLVYFKYSKLKYWKKIYTPVSGTDRPIWHILHSNSPQIVDWLSVWSVLDRPIGPINSVSTWNTVYGIKVGAFQGHAKRSTYCSFNSDRNVSLFNCCCELFLCFINTLKTWCLVSLTYTPIWSIYRAFAMFG